MSPSASILDVFVARAKIDDIPTLFMSKIEVSQNGVFSSSWDRIFVLGTSSSGVRSRYISDIKFACLILTYECEFYISNHKHIEFFCSAEKTKRILVIRDPNRFWKMNNS